MTSRDFCYWLQGFFEINSLKNEKVKITDAQSSIIQAHLNLVFKHEIDPENFKDKSEKEINIYEAIHKGAKSSTAFKKEIQPQPFRIPDSEIKFNC